MDWKQKTVEWRLADGKPFAVIMRKYDYAGNDQCATDGKITGESLIVVGLKGYEIDETVDAKTPNANAKARELADKGYVRPKREGNPLLIFDRSIKFEKTWKLLTGACRSANPPAFALI